MIRNFLSCKHVCKTCYRFYWLAGRRRIVCNSFFSVVDTKRKSQNRAQLNQVMVCTWHKGTRSVCFHCIKDNTKFRNIGLNVKPSSLKKMIFFPIGRNGFNLELTTFIAQRPPSWLRLRPLAIEFWWLSNPDRRQMERGIWSLRKATYSIRRLILFFDFFL